MAGEKEMINISIPKEFEPLLKDLFEKDDTAKNIQLLSSIMLFIAKQVTFERSAELSGNSLNNFIDILNKLGINWMEYGEEEFLDDMEALKKIQGE